jgi:hypothetical protein
MNYDDGLKDYVVSIGGTSFHIVARQKPLVNLKNRLK